MTTSTGSAAHVAGHVPGGAMNPLANEDLLPTTQAQRHWAWKDYAALWVRLSLSTQSIHAVDKLSIIHSYFFHPISIAVISFTNVSSIDSGILLCVCEVGMCPAINSALD